LYILYIVQCTEGVSFLYFGGISVISSILFRE
jgi:hypothetical protein